MLAKMILPVKRPLLEAALLAGCEIVTLDVSFVRLKLVTKCTAECPIGIDSARSKWSADPSLERQMQRLLMSLPGVLGSKGLGAECTLECVAGSYKGSLAAAVLFHAPPLATEPTVGNAAERAGRVATLKRVG